MTNFYADKEIREGNDPERPIVCEHCGEQVWFGQWKGRWFPFRTEPEERPGFAIKRHRVEPRIVYITRYYGAATMADRPTDDDGQPTRLYRRHVCRSGKRTGE